MPGTLDADDVMVGANRYIRVKFRIAPTTKVEKTKSSSFNPKLGLEAMSPKTQALTPTSSSIKTLKGNCGSAATLDLHPFRKRPKIPKEESLESPSSPPPPPPPPPPRPTPSPPFPPAKEGLSL
ncbi:hypothetical protein V8G54_021088 [Vigna mungo]|uniref:Uncharacterized protein n=1 Tax=Vigna mungo TaxID=3915 RepID=A0AAQ3RVC1_VIGMU